MNINIIARQTESRVNSRETGIVEVRTLQTVAEVEELRSYWTSWQSHPNADIDFFLMICGVRPEIIRPHVIVVYRDGVPDALLVGRLEDVRIELTLGYSRLGHIRASRLAFNHGGFLGRTTFANGEVLVREVVRSLKEGAAGVAFFSHLPTDSPLYHSAKEVPRLWSRDYASNIQIRAHRSMTLPPSVEMLYRRLPGKKRKNLKWQAKKLLADFPNEVRIRTFCDASDLGVMFRDIEQVAQQAYQRGLGVGFSDTEEMRSRMALSADNGWLQAHVLYISEQPCAFWVGALYQNVFHSNFMGYDRAFAKYSPGVFLMVKVIERFCERTGEQQVREIDFGLGDAQYKEMLADREWTEGSVSVYAPTWAGLRINLALTVPALVDGLAKGVFARTTLLQRVKTFWRRCLAHGDKRPTSTRQSHTGKSGGT
jgi:hypothetical protein